MGWWRWWIDWLPKLLDALLRWWHTWFGGSGEEEPGGKTPLEDDEIPTSELELQDERLLISPRVLKTPPRVC